jgi:hypothetical protein
MPLELPGFYFDVARNRYFPTNSQPSGSNLHSSGPGPVPKDRLPVVAPDEARRQLRMQSKERITKIQRGIINALGSTDRFDALQYVISKTVKPENINLTN